MHVGVEEAVAQRVAQEGLDHRAAELLAGRSPRPRARRGRTAACRRSIRASARRARCGPSRPPARGSPDRPWCSPPSPTAPRPRAAGPSRSRPSGAASRPPRSAAAAAPPADMLSACARRRRRRRDRPEAPLDAGPQHLHRDRAPALPRVVDLGAMHLRDRGGGDRRPERRETPLRAACRARPRSVRSASACGNGAILSCSGFEIARERDADHVGPRRQELAELDVGRPEPGQRGRQARFAAPRRWPAARSAARARKRGRAGTGSCAGSTSRTRPRARTRSRRGRDGRDAREPGDHNRQPECSATMPPVMRWNETRAKPAARIISAKASGRGKRRIDSTR